MKKETQARAPMRAGSKYIRAALLFSLGAVLLADAVFSTMTTNMHTGIVLTYVIGALFLACCVIRLIPGEKVPAIVLYIMYVFYAGAALALALVAAVFIYGKTDTVTFDEDAVIVLGAAVRGGEPGPALSLRLDAALEYHRRAPDAFIVVSGGQGEDESVSEADAMARYLTERGVPADRIIKESSSTSTRENFLFSSRLLGKDSTVAYITSDYHVLRAGILASRAGVEGAAHLHSPTPPHLMLPNGLREVAAIIVQTLSREA